MVSILEVTERFDVEELKQLIQNHVKETGSFRGQEVLDNFVEYLPKFKKIVPNDYDKMLKRIRKFEQKGLSQEDAVMEAFNASKKG